MFAKPTDEQWAAAYLRFFEQRTRRPAEEIEDRFFTASGGGDIRRNARDFVRWAVSRLPSVCETGRLN